MPKYFFHVVSNFPQKDTAGITLPNQATVLREAVRVAGSLLNDAPDLLGNGRDFRLEVTDENGKLMLTVVTLAIEAAVVN